MNRVGFYSFLILIAFNCNLAFAQDTETLTLITYYPAPYGVYETLSFSLLIRIGSHSYGINRNTHTNLGVNSTTSKAGFNYSYITISGGYNNEAIHDYTTISGGGSNKADPIYSTIAGGYLNETKGAAEYSTIGGGRENRTGGTFLNQEGQYTTIGGGEKNIAEGKYTTISGGLSNYAKGFKTTIGGGKENKTDKDESTVGGGYSNEATEAFATISGGFNNSAFAEYSTICGGRDNSATDSHAFVGGGRDNDATDIYTTVGGGRDNTASNDYATVGGGKNNKANAFRTTVGGGENNIASGEYSTISGGKNYTTSNANSTVGGGESNTAEWGGTVAGGINNKAYGVYSAVGGGQNNEARGFYSMIPGGINCSTGVNSDYNFAAGRRAKANHSGCFVWADRTNADYASNGVDQFRIRASGGVWFGGTQKWSDIAEFMDILKAEGITKGELVSIREYDKLGRAIKSYDENLVGVVSSDKTLTLHLGDEKPSYDDTERLPIALGGRVLVKVNNENGPIKIGDPITSSSKPGIGMKANMAGKIIGYAMEDFNNSDGEILVFVNLAYYVPPDEYKELKEQVYYLEKKLSLLENKIIKKIPH